MEEGRAHGWRRSPARLRHIWTAARSRRAAASVAVGLALGGVLGPPFGDETEAKGCPPCRRKKRGACKKKKPNGTPCGACRACRGGRCVARCDGDACCGSNEGCFAGACLRLGGDCDGTTDFCAEIPSAPCTFRGATGSCVKLNGGADFCASGISLSPGSSVCQTDADCRQIDGGALGPHARCVAECPVYSSGGVCVTLAGER